MTITSNIHPNLPGWSNASYSAGDRIYNGANAYVCSTAGTSTAPPTGTGTAIAPGGTSQWNFLSTYDYVDLVSWSSSIPTTLTQPVVGVLWINANSPIIGSTGVQILLLSGHTTSITNTITLKAAPIDGFQAIFQANPTTPYATTNGVVVVMPYSGAGNTTYIEVDDAWVTFQGLQFVDINRSNASNMIGGSGAHFTMMQCVLDGYSAASWPMINLTGASATLTNNLILERGSDGVAAWSAFISGTGARVANNTFSQGGGTGASTALHSGANTTTASNTATNNIFVNYGTDVFKANSGTPWSTNHNAYSNSSFGTNGTDTGGSLYNIIPSKIFLSFINDFHLAPGGGFSNGFSLGFSYQSCINAGATDTTDIPAANDAFGTSRPQGAAWDIGAHEATQPTYNVIRDFFMPVAFSYSEFRDIPSPADYKFGRFQDSIILTDWRSAATNAVSQSNIPVEFQASWPVRPSSGFSSGFSVGFGSGVWTSTPAMTAPVEWSLSQTNYTKNVTFPLEWRGSRVIDKEVSADWRSVTIADSGGNIDWQIPFKADVVSPTEWVRTSVGVNSTSSIEWRSTVNFTTLIPAEWSGFAGIFRDTVISVEWKASPLSAATAPSDFQSSPVANTTASMEWLAYRSFSGQPVSAEWGNTVTETVPLVPVEWPVSFLVNAAVPIESISTVQRTMQAPQDASSTAMLSNFVGVESSLSVIAQTILPNDHITTSQSDITSPIDFGGGKGSIADITTGVEWKASTVADTAIQIVPLSTIKEDAASPSEWTAGRQRDAVAPIDWVNPLITADATAAVEWGHTLSTTTRDVTFTTEHLSIISTDVTVSYFLNIGRESIGASLQPDEWECDHEP